MSSDDDLAMNNEDEETSLHRLILARQSSRNDVVAVVAADDDDNDDDNENPKPPTANNNNNSNSSARDRLEQLLDESPPRTVVPAVAAGGRIVIDDSFDWSPRTPAMGQPLDTTPPAALQLPRQQQHQQQPQQKLQMHVDPAIATPPPPPAPHNATTTPSPVPQQQQQQQQQSAARPMTWSARKAKATADSLLTSSPTPTATAAAAAALATDTQTSLADGLSGVSSVFIPTPQQQSHSRQHPQQQPAQQQETRPPTTTNGNGSSISPFSNNNSFASAATTSATVIAKSLFAQLFDSIATAEEYRRMSIESRQNEARCHLAVGFAQLAIRLHQRALRPDCLEAPLAKWFRKWAKAGDSLLERKLHEANSFLEHQLMAASMNSNGSNNNLDLARRGSSGNMMLIGMSPRSPSLHSTVNGTMMISATAHNNNNNNAMMAIHMNAAALEHTVTRERKGSSPPLLQTASFANVPGLQKSVLSFARNFMPINAPPSSGQVRADGILADMANWGPGDYNDIAYLTAPLVLVVGPRGGGKSSVVHCLTNKKPFFSTLPKVQPTVGFDAHVAQLKDVQTTGCARVTLTTELMQNATVSQSVFGGDSNNNESSTSPATSQQQQAAQAALRNYSFIAATRTYSTNSIAARVMRATPGPHHNKSGGSSEDNATITLKSSANLRFLEVPLTMLSSLPSRALPLSGFELAMVFDITLDGARARRELTAQFRQVAAAVMAAVQDRGEVMQPVLIPVYLFATHVDKMRSAERNANALTGLLRDLRLWFKFVQEATVGGGGSGGSAGHSGTTPHTTNASPASPSASSASVFDGTTAASAASAGAAPATPQSYIHFYLVDVYAVSCQEWTVAGERPRSATTFAEVSAEMFRTMAVLRPLTPVHIGAQILEQFVEALSSYDDAAGGGAGSIENIDGIRSALSIRSDAHCHIGTEIAVRQVLDGKLTLPVPVRRVIVGVTTFLTGVGRWVDSCGYFVDYALFLRLVLQHVQCGKLLQDVAGITASDPTYEHLSRVFGRCMQYAFVDVLSYHGIITVDEEEGFSSVLVGPQLFTRVINCFHSLAVATAAARQLNVTEKAAGVFNEHKQCAEFPEIGKTDRDYELGSTAGDAAARELDEHLHTDVMRDLTAWQFGVVTPFAWRALLRGHLATMAQSDNDFFVWCSRIVAPMGFLEPRWSPAHIDFVAHPTPAPLAPTPTSARQLHQHQQQSSNQNPQAEPGPILLSTLFAKPVDARTHHFLLASLTTADDSQQPATSTGTFSGCPVSPTLPQAVLISLLHSAATSEAFTMQDIAVWSNCLCFSTYWRSSVESPMAWDYCCMVMVHWELYEPVSLYAAASGAGHGGAASGSSSSSSASAASLAGGVGFSSGGVGGVGSSAISQQHSGCRIAVAGVSASGSPKRGQQQIGGGSFTTASSSGTPLRSSLGLSAAGHHHHHVTSPGQDSLAGSVANNSAVVDVSSAVGALEWVKRDIERTLLAKNQIAELRPNVVFRDSKLGSATPVTFTGVAQTAREILAGCSRKSAENLLEDLQTLHERTWSEKLPLRSILQTLMLEERVAPHYGEHE